MAHTEETGQWLYESIESLGLEYALIYCNILPNVSSCEALRLIALFEKNHILNYQAAASLTSTWL